MTEAYKLEHTRVWPEMRDALRESGWHNYTLFIKPDGTVFGYFETDESLEVAQERMRAHPVNARWQATMAPFVGTRPDETFVLLTEYFHLD